MTTSPPPPPPIANHGPADNPGRMITARQYAGLLVFVLVVVLIVENLKSVDVRLIGPVVHLPLAVVVIISAALGALGFWLVQLRRRRG